MPLVLSSQSLDVVLKEANIIQQKQTAQDNMTVVKRKESVDTLIDSVSIESNKLARASTIT